MSARPEVPTGALVRILAAALAADVREYPEPENIQLNVLNIHKRARPIVTGTLHPIEDRREPGPIRLGAAAALAMPALRGRARDAQA